RRRWAVRGRGCGGSRSHAGPARETPGNPVVGQGRTGRCRRRYARRRSTGRSTVRVRGSAELLLVALVRTIDQIDVLVHVQALELAHEGVLLRQRPLPERELERLLVHMVTQASLPQGRPLTLLRGERLRRRHDALATGDLLLELLLLVGELGVEQVGAAAVDEAALEEAVVRVQQLLRLGVDARPADVLVELEGAVVDAAGVGHTLHAPLGEHLPLGGVP